MTSKAKRDIAAMMALELPFFYSRRKAPAELPVFTQADADRIVSNRDRAERKRAMRAGKLHIQAATWKQQHA